MYTENLPERQLHHVAFDIPVPVNYGGAIDIYYKIKALSAAGIKIHLHCFQYGRDPAEELEKYCTSVTYYPRKSSPFLLLHSLPYIVNTRASEFLLENLVQKPLPILFEGLHSCRYLDHPALTHRKKIVRTHNIEHDYYSNLGSVEKNFLKKSYFHHEAMKLAKFQDILSHAQGIAAISRKDQQHFLDLFPNSRIENISAFHPFENIEYTDGTGNFALYHGSLEVGENNQAAIFLITQVFNALDIPFVIAGNKPSRELTDLVNRSSNVTLKSNLTTGQIYELIKEAQVNILPTFQATGIKLKLLSALFTGRHCIVNQPMVENTGLESLCHICDTADQMKDTLTGLMNTPFSEEESNNREKVLRKGGFYNDTNAEALINMIFKA
ncbi:MAG: glycosyltransferase [Bacteroidales bacterium]